MGGAFWIFHSYCFPVLSAFQSACGVLTAGFPSTENVFPSVADSGLQKWIRLFSAADGGGRRGAAPRQSAFSS